MLPDVRFSEALLNFDIEMNSFWMPNSLAANGPILSGEHSGES